MQLGGLKLHNNATKTYPSESKCNFTNSHKRLDICITGNRVKNFTSTTVPGSSTNSDITKYDRKLFLVGDSHQKNKVKLF